MSADADDFDIDAAWVRRASGDMRAFMEALAARLEPALPGRVEVERHRDGFFSKTSHVSRIEVRLDDALLSLAFERGRLHAKRAKVVRDVAISSAEITVPDWLGAILRSTRTAGEQDRAAHGMLNDFLLS